ncbi:hypothetical protein LOTGIDRAFT_164820 [Lottia gigantea]|uniref:C-type lectin domain-containing protein n=1 Tax=Lottia gigantea TaxID=225164 RepID=V4A905_LOTGI|nr:hypothetical protein LOTGIDRAFT_164820 [Lottia gigantea]ESO89786.1 hypothetical protein LOTGIDRAFT_164820 [Lottia gigantea]
MTPLLVFITLLVVPVLSSCPNGYDEHDGSCYAVVPIKTTWPEASTYCGAIGGYLSVVDGDVERNYLKNYINNKYGTLYNYYWIGGHNYIDGSWSWGSRPIDNIKWNPGDPTGRVGEKCLMMVQKTDYLFSDFECDAKNAFLCEARAN